MAKSQTAAAGKVLTEWAILEEETGRVFLTDKLAELARHRNDLDAASPRLMKPSSKANASK